MRQTRGTTLLKKKSARYRSTLWLAPSQQAIICAILVHLVLLVLATKGGSSVLGHTERPEEAKRVRTELRTAGAVAALVS